MSTSSSSKSSSTSTAWKSSSSSSSSVSSSTFSSSSSLSSRSTNSSSSSYSTSSSSTYSLSSSSSVSSSSSSTSSTSVNSLSSSSSSLWDKNTARTLPFTYQTEIDKSVKTIVSSGSYTYLGLGNSGTVIRSLDKYHWEDFYRTEDQSVTAIAVRGQYIYIGTSPEGGIYKISLSDNTSYAYTPVNSNPIAFIDFLGSFYMITSYHSNVYKLNERTNEWDIFYEIPFLEVYTAKILNRKIYICGKNENIISFDGEHWTSVVNTAVLQKITINKLASNNFPSNRALGIRSIAGEEGNLLLGTSNCGRIYTYSDTLEFLFDTEGNAVYDILSIETGVFLASIGNKIFLIYANTPSGSSIESNSSQSESTVISKIINIVSPNGGEQISLGSDTLIQWTSTKGENDAVKISLYKGDTEYLVINSKTVNSGTYDWTIPLSLPDGIDYKVYVEWLSAGTSSPSNSDLSDGYFSLLTQVPSTSSSESEIALVTPSNYSEGFMSVPVLELDNEHVSIMQKDYLGDGVLFGTSNGRLLGCNVLQFNAYMTGYHGVYANVYGENGYKSLTTTTEFMYALYKRVAEVNENKEVIINKFENAYGSFASDEITAIFTSPALYVKEDAGTWNQLIWTENKLGTDSVIVGIKTSTTEDGLNDTPWRYYFESTSVEVSPIIRNLNNLILTGQYAQIQLILKANVHDVTPFVSSISVVYSTKAASYFYTVKFSLEEGTQLKNGLLIANVTQPINTEIKFGICSTNSNDWNDYIAIEPNRLFTMNDYRDVKVGIKMVSYDVGIPSVGEFALIVGGDPKQIVSY